jgi:sulfide dehydrogenase [flavocytochrome c] flavoprotein subunit
VIVIGAGFGGATFAKHFRLLAPNADVLLIDRRPSFFTGPFTNLVITRLRESQTIRFALADIARRHGVRALCDEVVEVDPVARRVVTAAHGMFEADRIVISPGVAMRWDRIEGLDAGNCDAMPHAWLGDAQVLALRDRLDALPDGATVLIASPPNPYRCPPAPYERASLIAHRLTHSGRRHAKIVIADGKDDFTQRALFQLEWDRLYPGMIDWRPRAQGGEALRVDVESGEVWLAGGGEPIRTQLASVIPPQQAAALAFKADLVDESGWCPVDPVSFESTRHGGIHVLGDAAAAAPVPKAAFAANSEARQAAGAIAATLAGRPSPDPSLASACYSLIAGRAAISLSGRFGVIADRLSNLGEQSSPLAGDPALRVREARAARAWYAALTNDSFGDSFNHA